jgi:diguanylate cyclase (GGDEF)-like protein
MSIRGVRRDDAAVGALGVAVSIALSVPWLAHPQLHIGYAVGFLVAVLALSRMPADLPSQHGLVEISFTPAALVFMALRTSTGEACTLWLLVTLVLRLAEKGKPTTDRLFNVGCVAGSGVAALLVLSQHGRVLEARTAVLVAIACAVYFVTDMWLTTSTLAHRQAQRRWALLPIGLIAIPLVCFVGIDSLGYLAAVIDVTSPWWMLALLIAPLSTIFGATRSQQRARGSERRTAAVYTIARATTSVDGPTDMMAVLLAELERLLPGRDIQVLDRPPNATEIGAELSTVEGHPSWVVVGAGTGYGFTDDDRVGLETLTSVSLDMLDRRRLLDELARLAAVDSLTGLANRATLVGRLDQMSAALPDDAEVTAAVLYCDVDGFKGINDRLGHAVGDSAIVATAGRLRSCLRSGDTAARLSGDEFAVLFERVDRAAAVQLAERIVTSFETPLDVDGRPLRVGVSVGIAMVSAGDSAEGVLRDADTAMYSAKAAGKGRAACFDPESRRALERELVLEDSLRKALAEESLWLAWQPVIELASGKLDGFEVLIRWTHPDFGNIPPDTLLPIASRIGLMPALGRWILVQAMEQGLRLSAIAGRPLAIAVNVAPEQLDDEHFIELAAEYGADRRLRLVLELTEHTLIEGDSAIAVIERLHSCGTAIALDDFGSGYSSIDYLHRFGAIDAIKIDRSFIAGLSTDPRSGALVDSIAAMARAFDALVVAEGIEDWDSALTVHDLGCQLGQGYLFGRPAPIESAMEIATAGRIEGPWPELRESATLTIRS